MLTHLEHHDGAIGEQEKDRDRPRDLQRADGLGVVIDLEQNAAVGCYRAPRTQYDSCLLRTGFVDRNDLSCCHNPPLGDAQALDLPMARLASSASAIICKPKFTSAAPIFRGGASLTTRSAFSVQLMITPRASDSRTKVRAVPGFTNSIPISATMTRTAAISAEAIRRNPCAISSPSTFARSQSRSLTMTSSAASPAAHDSGWPPKVVIWPSGGPRPSSPISPSEPQNAPNGRPPPSAFAITTRSGTNPNCSIANSRPVR